MIQATDKTSIRNAVNRFGPAPGAQAMLSLEMQAAQLAIERGLYITWRSPSTKHECTRVGPGCKCFCGHFFQDHDISKKTNPCQGCACKRFQFIPQRPEEVGEWWLPRRKEFNINAYRVKCRCNHTHEEHNPNTQSCVLCSCYRFESNFLCLVCDKHWEEHEVFYEMEWERRAEGRTTGQEFLPLAQDRDIQEAVFNNPRPPGQFVRPQQKKGKVGKVGKTLKK